MGVLGLVACTITNPAYDAASDDADSEAAGTTEAADTTADPTASSEDGEGSEGTPEACEPVDERPLSIALHDHEQQPLAPDCSGAEPIRRIPLGRNIYSASEGTITHTPCDSQECPCPNASGLPTFIQLEGELPFADGIPLPDCGRVELWPTKDPARCEWAGLVLYGGLDYLPMYIAARTLEATPLDLGAGPLTLELRGEPCGGPETCEPTDPGVYGLGVFESTVEVGTQDYVDVEFLMGAQPVRYYFDSRMASVTPECEQRVAWTAQHFPE
jgi:hypothetical protein